jgi:hypothetical protein
LTRVQAATQPTDTTRISAASTARDWPGMTTNPEPMAIAISQISRLMLVALVGDQRSRWWV